MKKSIFLFIAGLLVASCSSNSESSEANAPEDKVLISTGSAIAYVGVLSGKVYSAKTYPYFLTGSYNKIDDKLYAMENSWTELQIVDANQFRNNSGFSSLDSNIIPITGIDGLSLIGPVFFVEQGYVHIPFITNDATTSFGIGKIDTSTGEFTSIYSGLEMASSSTNFLYDAIENKLYHFDYQSGLELYSIVDLGNGFQQIVKKDLGSIEFNAEDFLSLNFQSNTDRNFYFTTKVGPQRYISKFDCSNLQMESLGLLPTLQNNVNSSFYVNSKNKVYYTSWRGSGYSICTYDFESGVKTEEVISDENPHLGNILAEKVLFIDQ